MEVRKETLSRWAEMLKTQGQGTKQKVRAEIEEALASDQMPGKLVRDNIPALIEASGRKPHYIMLDLEEFRFYLKAKLVEEAGELFNAKTKEEELEELADVFEVFMQMVEHLGHKTNELIYAKVEKAFTKGGFDKRILLASVEARP